MKTDAELIEALLRMVDRLPLTPYFHTLRLTMLEAADRINNPAVDVWEDDGGPEYNPQRVQTMNYDDI